MKKFWIVGVYSDSLIPVFGNDIVIYHTLEDAKKEASFLLNTKRLSVVIMESTVDVTFERSPVKFSDIIETSV